MAIPSLFLLLALAAPSALQEPDADNVVILLDASGSMKDPMSGPGRMQKMEAAKRAIAEVLGHVPQSTQAGLLVFSGSHKQNDWVFPLGPRDDAKLIAALNRLGPDGGTPLGAYMKQAADRLLEQRTQQSGYGTYRMLVVTDGRADDDDQPLVDRFLPDILGRGIVVDVIGVAMEEDHPLAKRVHSYRRADDLPALRQAISEVFAEVGHDASSSAIANEGYELVAGLPDDAVAPILASLTNTRDVPIGTREAEAPSDAPPSDWAPAPQEKSRHGGSSAVWIALGVVFLVVVTRGMRGRARRRA
jgi:uncharacterized protein YegL